MYFIPTTISFLLTILFFILYLNATEKVRTLSLELKKKTKALDEAYEVLAGSKAPTCDMTGHELVKLKRRILLEPNNKFRYDNGVSISRNGDRWVPEGLTGKIVRAAGEIYSNQADLEIAYCVKCNRAIPCPPLQIELLPEYKDNKPGNPGETEKIGSF